MCLPHHLPQEEGAVNEAVCQVAFADRLLLNKIDLVPLESDLTRIEARLRGINSFAPIQRCTKSQVAVSDVLDICGFDLARTLARNPGELRLLPIHVLCASQGSGLARNPGELRLLSRHKAP